MTYGDYLDLFTSEDSFSLSPVETAGVLHKDIVDYQADADQAGKVWAEKNAKPNGEKFPLVVYAANFSGPGFENADLCEYLASLGVCGVAMHAGHMGVLQSLARRRSMCRCALEQALMFLER